MTEIVVSAVLTVLFEKLADTAWRNTARHNGIDAEIMKWQRSLTQIQDVLTDASRKEITNQSVKRWLNDLKHLTYDMDDVLDDLAYQAMEREFKRDSEAITAKVRKLIPTCCPNFTRSNRMCGNLENITSKLQELLQEKADLHLNLEVETRPKHINRKVQGHLSDPCFVGREVEKETFVDQLRANGPSNQNFSIVPIVGMGGVGKTTLASILYEEPRFKNHFELKAWVCISDEFDIFGSSKDIFTSIGGKVEDKHSNFNSLQEDLRECVSGKKFLFVLDDIWSESYDDWDTLVRPFHACAPGSKIIITTRNNNLLKKLSYVPLNEPLPILSDNHALSLLALHALDVENFDSHLSLKPYAKAIVKKCDGLPLALKALGRLLRTKWDEVEHWKEVSNSEIWRLKDEGGVVPALRLSYLDLSAPLKQLFSYCSLFPKDFLFEKEELVLLWMAERILVHQPTSSDSTIEHMGRGYFDELVSRSFFQHAPNNKSYFVMHDMMNDLAKSLAGEFFLRFDDKTEKNIRKEVLEKYRHMSFLCEDYITYKKFEAFKGAKSLRTFLATYIGAGVVESWQGFYLSNKILADLLPELPMLRVLSLRSCMISEVPESIGTLKHLRYLNLSRSKITHLPECVSNLYNLETLILFGCHSLAKLPNKLSMLRNLRHLDIRDTWNLKEMPPGMGDLKNLQTLSKIFIGGERGIEIRDLKNLEKLCGKASIAGFEKVQNAIHAREVGFSQKKLSELEVMWSDVSDGSQNELHQKEVLSELNPSNEYLKQLKVVSYGGLEFPSWIGDPSYLHLKHVSIDGCKKCTCLPPLRQLRALKKLSICNLDMVEVVGLELFGAGVAFSSLEILSIINMPSWEKWSTNSGVVFPRLQQLCIYGCPNLVEVSIEALPSLNILDIGSCNSCVLRRLIQVVSSVTKLEIKCMLGLDDVVWRSVIEYLGTVEELMLYECNDIRYVWESEAVVSKFLVNLRHLRVRVCDNLVSIGEKEDEGYCRSNLLTSLRMLEVSHCENMKRCCYMDNIESLRLDWCSSITNISLPRGVQKLKSLEIKGGEKLLETEWGGQKGNSNSSLPMLEHVDIDFWSNRKSIVELKHFVHLTKLSISRCESLESFPDNELSDLISLTKLEITDCRSIDACFPRGVWPPNLQALKIGKLQKTILEWGPQNFPTSLVELSLVGDEKVSSCSQFSHLLPRSLTSLNLSGFQKLESDSMGLQHLTSLESLYFYCCTNHGRTYIHDIGVDRHHSFSRA